MSKLILFSNFISSGRRRYFTIVAIFLDLILILYSFWLAFDLRYLDSSIVFDYSISKLWFGSILTSMVVITSLFLLRAYSHLNRNLDFSILLPLTIGSLSGFVAVTIFDFFGTAQIPRSIPIIQLLLNIVGLTSVRLVYRGISRRLNLGTQEPVIIFGAGATGRRLCNLISSDYKYTVVGFVDDDIGKKSAVISGVRVFPREKVQELYHRLNVRKVILCIPNSSDSELKAISRFFVDNGFGVLSIPRIDELLSGKARLHQSEMLDIANLTGRNEVEREASYLAEIYTGSVVLVTGAGGSIGSELCRQLVDLELSKLVLFEVSEFNLFKILSELEGRSKHIDSFEIIPVLGSILDSSLLQKVCEDHDVDTFFHAAAYKHVSLVEGNIAVAMKNNVIGTKNCVDVAFKQNVKRFVLVSSDKAVRPTNIMGASKRVSELIVQTRFGTSERSNAAIVRFGNVLNSSGSVIPIFRSQIAKGGPVTVTDPEVTRFFMTIVEASQLIIHCSSLESRGDVFVLDMGKPVKIVDLAKRLIGLSGLSLKNESNPEGDIEIVYTGLRPGEKMHEELSLEDSLMPTANAKVLREMPKDLNKLQIEDLLNALESAMNSENPAELKRLLSSPNVNYVREASL
mgnify:CR=1 FL=1